MTSNEANNKPIGDWQQELADLRLENLARTDSNIYYETCGYSQNQNLLDFGIEIEATTMSEWILNDGNRLGPIEPRQNGTKNRLKNLPVQNIQKITYLNHCPEEQCSKYYVDTLIGNYYFICLDKRHGRTSFQGKDC